MHRRPFIITGTKWVLTLLAAGVAVVWVCSLRWAIHWPAGITLFRVDACGGAALVGWMGGDQIEEESARIIALDKSGAGDLRPADPQTVRENVERWGYYYIGAAATRFDQWQWSSPWKQRVWWPPMQKDDVLPANGRIVPLWAPLACFAAPAMAFWWVQVWRFFRKAPGACKRCGYDLAGLTAGAVCPECGAAVSAAPVKVGREHGPQSS